MPRSLGFLPRLILAVLAGGALNLAFPPLGLWPLAVVAVAGLHLALGTRRAGQAFTLAFAGGLAFFLPLLSWAVVSVGSYLPWAALSASQAAVVGLYGLGRSLAVRAPWWPRGGSAFLDAAGSGALFVALEGARARFPFGGFGWGLIGYSQVEGPFGRLAAYGGTTLVGFAVVVVAVLLARLLTPPGDRATRFASRAGQVALAAILPLAATFAPLTARAEAGTLRVGVVQGNVPAPPLKKFADQARAVTANHRAQTLAMLKAEGPVDVIVWPESAADVDPRTDPGVMADVREAVQAGGVPLLLGTQQFFDGGRINQHLVLVPDGADAAIVGQYTKQHPVPFGEYIPLRDLFAKISSDVDKVGVDMVAGTAPAVLDVPLGAGQTVRVGDAICFEISVEDLLRESVNLGAELLIVPTNNASFGTSQEAAQQTMISRFRAIEHGRSVVQASTVGISAIIDPRGRVVADTGMWRGAHLVQNVALRTTRTPADRIGLAPVIAAGAAALGWVGAGLVRRQPRASRRRRTDV